jgi:hypothetical protein
VDAGFLHSTRINGGLIMWKDKIVEEVRKNRERILENANFDMNKVIEDIKKLEASHKNRLITKPFNKDVVIA